MKRLYKCLYCLYTSVEKNLLDNNICPKCGKGLYLPEPIFGKKWKELINRINEEKD